MRYVVPYPGDSKYRAIHERTQTAEDLWFSLLRVNHMVVFSHGMNSLIQITLFNPITMP